MKLSELGQMIDEYLKYLPDEEIQYADFDFAFVEPTIHKGKNGVSIH